MGTENKFHGQKIVLGFSGGPDAAALAYRLRILGAEVWPVYVNYRKFSGGGKTAKDLRAAELSAAKLSLRKPIRLRAPLGSIPKSRRNRFFVRVLSELAQANGSKFVALGTLREASFKDVNPKVLLRTGKMFGTQIITWDYFGIRRKADEFALIDEKARKALFKTTSCQLWWRLECGNCFSCISRHEAFTEAFGYDPTRYRPGSRIYKLMKK